MSAVVSRSRPNVRDITKQTRRSSKGTTRTLVVELSEHSVRWLRGYATPLEEAVERILCNAIAEGRASMGESPTGTAEDLVFGCTYAGGQADDPESWMFTRGRIFTRFRVQ